MLASDHTRRYFRDWETKRIASGVCALPANSALRDSRLICHCRPDLRACKGRSEEGGETREDADAEVYFGIGPGSNSGAGSAKRTGSDAVLFHSYAIDYQSAHIGSRTIDDAKTIT